MPGATFESDNDDFDSQDQSETLDESNLIGDADLEEDDELGYRAATAEREDDLDGQGPEDSFNEDCRGSEISDQDLIDLGYAERKGGEVRAKPDD